LKKDKKRKLFFDFLVIASEPVMQLAGQTAFVWELLSMHYFLFWYANI
jgi:hypothetical protein